MRERNLIGLRVKDRLSCDHRAGRRFECPRPRLRITLTVEMQFDTSRRRDVRPSRVRQRETRRGAERKLTRAKTRSRRSTDVFSEVAIEYHGFGREAVKVRSLNPLVAVAPESRCREAIQRDDDCLHDERPFPATPGRHRKRCAMKFGFSGCRKSG